METKLPLKKSSNLSGRHSFLNLEEFDKEKDQEFLKNVVVPYFSELFEDLEKREENGTPGQIAKAVFIEYCNLPGIIADRYYKLMDPSDKGYITMRDFV